ncbi:MAG: sigma-70 family RNA polymerase sigma factor [Clostridia bacterium]|nr:sigma-70 family RNA polymerase sigma factor [Clostridia bacterium]
MEDEKIIELFFQRSEIAIPSLAQKYEKPLFSVSYRILQNREDAQECIKDTYLGIWNAIPPTRPASLYSFACRVARNISINRHKHNCAAKRNSYTVSIEEIGDCIPASNTVAEDFELQLLTDTLNQWLESLRPQNRYIFVRRYWYMDPVPQIATAMKMSDAAIYLRLDRLKKKLYKYLKERGYPV